MPRRPKMRDRALSVTCPTCGAPPAESCGMDAQGKSDVHPQRIALADKTVFSRADKTKQGEGTALSQHHCPSCGGPLISEPVGTSLRCTRCDWRLISHAAWRKLSPFHQGYVFYMQAAWPTSELSNASNPHAENTRAWEEFRRGEYSAMLNVQDSEE